MAEVFISYAREDRDLAEQLANYLRSRGVTVWWDVELVGADQYQDVIMAALANAKAAVVIWSRTSVKSLFVRDEARFALYHKKLVAVKTDDINIMDIPLGFQGQHTDSISNTDNLVKSIRKLGVISIEPGSAVSNQSNRISWPEVSKTKQLNDVLDWLERNPRSPNRNNALRHAQQLIGRNKLTATIFSILFFVATPYALVVTAALFPNEFIAIPIFLFLTVTHFILKKFLRQRYLVAATITALVTIFLWSAFSIYLSRPFYPYSDIPAAVIGFGFSLVYIGFIVPYLNRVSSSDDVQNLSHK